MLRKFYYNMKPFLERLGDKSGYEGLIPYLTESELRDYLENEELPEKDEIKRRKESYLLLMRDGEIDLYSKKWEIMEILKEELREEEIEVLSGQGVYGGKVRGPVTMVEGPEEDITRGDVLVCGMTSPDMMPLIKKAVAIVTDEGGMTSHAAVISKEMGIPSVIGTGDATEKLEENDWVEVNANEGKVVKTREELPSVYNQMSTVAGFKRPYSKVTQFLKGTNKEVLILSVGEDIPEETEEVLENLHDSGVNIRFIATKRDEENIDILKRFNEKWVDEIRYKPQFHKFTFTVIDGKKCFEVTRNPRDPEDRFMIFFQNEDLSQLFKNYFEKIWKESKKIEFGDD